MREKILELSKHIHENGEEYSVQEIAVAVGCSEEIVKKHLEESEEENSVKGRTVILNLSDEDCERLVKKCGMYGLTIGELIENFVRDLVGGTYSNGSDERDYANRWFDRCWFGMFPEQTLLNHLLSWGYNPEDYLDALDNIERAEKDKEYYAEHPEEADEEELAFIDDDIEMWQEELKDMREDWKPKKEPNMEEEIEGCRKYLDDYERLMGE